MMTHSMFTNKHYRVFPVTSVRVWNKLLRRQLR